MQRFYPGDIVVLSEAGVAQLLKILQIGKRNIIKRHKKVMPQDLIGEVRMVHQSHGQGINWYTLEWINKDGVKNGSIDNEWNPDAWCDNQLELKDFHDMRMGMLFLMVV